MSSPRREGRQAAGHRVERADVADQPAELPGVEVEVADDVADVADRGGGGGQQPAVARLQRAPRGRRWRRSSRRPRRGRRRPAAPATRGAPRAGGTPAARAPWRRDGDGAGLQQQRAQARLQVARRPPCRARSRRSGSATMLAAPSPRAAARSSTSRCSGPAWVSSVELAERRDRTTGAAVQRRAAASAGPRRARRRWCGCRRRAAPSTAPSSPTRTTSTTTSSVRRQVTPHAYPVAPRLRRQPAWTRPRARPYRSRHDPRGGLLRPRPHADPRLGHLPARRRRLPGRLRAAARPAARRRLGASASSPTARTDEGSAALRERILRAVAGHPAEDVIALGKDFIPQIAASVLPEARLLLAEHAGARRGPLRGVGVADRDRVAARRRDGLEGGIGTRSEIDADGRYTGRLDGPFCYREGKVAELAADRRARGLRPRRLLRLQRLDQRPAVPARPSGTRSPSTPTASCARTPPRRAGGSSRSRRGRRVCGAAAAPTPAARRCVRRRPDEVGRQRRLSSALQRPQHPAHVADGARGPADRPGDLAAAGARQVVDVDLDDASSRPGPPARPSRAASPTAGP